jgi:predicted  nucleic acid-binding Zn-ribbon protein
LNVEFQIFVYRKNLEEAQEKFRSLYSAYETVVKELQNFHEQQKSKDRHSNAYHEVQARGFTEKIDSMTAQLINLEEALAQKSKEHTQLMENIKKLELENEAVAILKAQV